MGQKTHKRLRRTARSMAAVKRHIANTTTAPLIPIDQEQYHVEGTVRNNPLSERGTIRWLKKHAK